MADDLADVAEMLREEIFGKETVGQLETVAGERELALAAAE